MIGLFCFVLAVLGLPFKSKRLEAENAVLRHQLIVLKRRLHGRVRVTSIGLLVIHSAILKAARRCSIQTKRAGKLSRGASNIAEIADDLLNPAHAGGLPSIVFCVDIIATGSCARGGYGVSHCRGYRWDVHRRRD